MDKVIETREQRLAGIRERESKATRGPWHRGDVEGFTGDCVYREDGVNICKALLPEKKSENLDFIAHARADIPYLLSALDSEIERVLLEAAKAVCSYCRDNIPLDGTRIHRYSTGMFMDTCKAHAIHDLRSKGDSR